jgi:predicted nucleic acid-binding protein
VRIVADTNTVVSGLLWGGAPQEILNAARTRRITLYSSTVLVADYASLAKLVVPAEIGPVVLADPDDDHVLACAIAAQAELIVTRDKHLRNLKTYQRIPIVNAARALELIG